MERRFANYVMLQCTNDVRVGSYLETVSGTRLMAKTHPFDLFRGGFSDLIRPPPDNIPTLDVLRSMAILLVFSAHVGGVFEASPRVSKLPLIYFGWSGVDLFFVLSGLLIGTQLWKEVQRSGRIQVGVFLLRRGLRIWPLYFSLAALLGAEILFAGRSPSGLWSDVLFLSNYFHNQIGGGWSLSTEEQFYVLAPVCISISALKVKPRHLWLLPVAGLLVPLISRAISMAHSALNEADLRQKLYFPSHTHSDGLLIGMLLGWFVVFHPALVRSTRIRVFASAVLFVVGIGLYLVSHVLFNFTALALIFGAATCLGMGLATTPWILNWRGFYLISRLSYGVYLNHFGILPRIHAVLWAWRLQAGEVGFWICFAISLVVCLGFAALTFQLIEWPFLQIRSRWLASRKRRQLAMNPVGSA